MDTPASGPATPGAPLDDLSSRIGVRGTLPVNDPIDLAFRYRRTATRAAAAKAFAGEADVGSSRAFAVIRFVGGTGSSTPPGSVTVTATLLARTEHAYFYADDALSTDPQAVEQAAAEFEATVWPIVTGAFGNPLTPGVDGDPRIIVLHADLGGAVGGYYRSEDAYLRTVRQSSNEAEMVYLDRDVTPGTATFTVVLAHELQHLILARSDTDEEVWVNEGLSENALMLAGGAASTIDAFEARPETQLNAWSVHSSQPHYGAAAAFLRYLADRFAPGSTPEAALGGIAMASGDGAAGIDEFLAAQRSPRRFRDVFADSIAANIVNAAVGPYANPFRRVEAHVGRSLAPGESVSADAHQFGADYYGLSDLGGDLIVRFAGQSTVAVLPAAALANGVVNWSNAEDDVDTSMTYAADLSNAESPALTFSSWYDIEPWYDWGYVSASTDGGVTWTALSGDHTTANDPVQLSYGPGYSGTSGGGDEPAWVDERVDLTAYAGRQVLLSFEYVTDGAYHAAGWAVRDVAVNAPGASLTRTSTAGWISIDHPLRQTYAVRVIAMDAIGDATVLDVPVSASGAGDLRFDTTGLDDVVVAVAGTTEGTEELAPYTIQLLRP